MERSEAKRELLNRVHRIIKEYSNEGKVRFHHDTKYFLYFAQDEDVLNEMRDKIISIYHEYDEFDFDVNKCIPYMSSERYRYVTFTTKPCIKSVFIKAGEPIKYKSNYSVEYNNAKLKEFKNTVGIDVVFTEKTEDGKKFLVSNYDLKLYYNTGTHKFFCGVTENGSIRFRSWAILTGASIVQDANMRKKRSDDIESKCDLYLTINLNDDKKKSTKYYALVAGGTVGAMDDVEEIELML